MAWIVSLTKNRYVLIIVPISIQWSIRKFFLTISDLLEICDSENASEAINAEQQLTEANDAFEKDFEMVTGERKEKNKIEESSSERDLECDYDGSLALESDTETDSDTKPSTKKRKTAQDKDSNNKKHEPERCIEDSDDSVEAFDDEEQINSKNEDDKNKKEDSMQGTWEDIYGRLRDKDGAIIQVFIFF